LEHINIIIFISIHHSVSLKFSEFLCGLRGSYSLFCVMTLLSQPHLPAF